MPPSGLWGIRLGKIYGGDRIWESRWRVHVRDPYDLHSAVADLGEQLGRELAEIMRGDAFGTGLVD